MELKATLVKPYTEEERINFIVQQNDKFGYEIRETRNTLQAWGLTEEEKRQKERERIDALTLTPSDVERAIYYGLGMDFEDLKELIKEKAPSIDIKGLSIEFRANNFYRGAVDRNGNRIVDMIGTLLGYTPEEMDYLFQTKSLPEKSQEDEEEPQEESEAS